MPSYGGTGGIAIPGSAPNGSSYIGLNGQNGADIYENFGGDGGSMPRGGQGGHGGIISNYDPFQTSTGGIQIWKATIGLTPGGGAGGSSYSDGGPYAVGDGATGGNGVVILYF
jgi:hypothetical protein